MITLSSTSTASRPLPERASTLVLDTNVILDWLVFRNPDFSSLWNAIEEGRVRWLTSDKLRAEFVHVLGRGTLPESWRWDSKALWMHWDRHATPTTDPPTLARPRVRCTDPDDQKFIDLALSTRAQWLITRDRAVLKTSRAARTLGLSILHPKAWPPRPLAQE